MKKELLIKLLFIVGFIFIIFICFYNLGKAPLENWDEAWFAEATKHILRTHEFIALQWNHAYFIDKPPLYMWMSALFSSVLGLSELSVRLTSAISGAVIILVVLLYSYKQYGLVPSFLAFSSIALNNIFIWRTRTGNIDVFLSLLILASYFLLISKNKYKYPLLGIMFALIYLTKASVVFYPLSIFLLHEIFFERNNLRKNLAEYIKLFLLFLSSSGIWLLFGYLKVGPDFPTYYLFKSAQGADKVNLMKFNSDYISYTYYSLQRRFFWVFLIGTIFMIKNIKNSRHFLLLLYAFLLLLQLSFISKSNNWYLTPAMPFWSLIIAHGTCNFIKIFKNNKALILIIILLSSYVSYKTFTINIVPILNTSSTIKQTESSKLLNTLTKENEMVVRLDHLYPSTVFYSDRRVLASPEGNTTTRGYWIGRDDLINAVQKKQIRWIVGVQKDIGVFQKKIPSDVKFNVIKVNDEETIIQIL